jgi:hypothetical protein
MYNGIYLERDKNKSQTYFYIYREREMMVNIYIISHAYRIKYHI